MGFQVEGLPGLIGNELLARGYAPHIAAGILGNIQQESAFDTGAVGDNGNAFGLAQWNGPRRRAYLAFAQERSADPKDWRTQVDFLEREFKGSEARAFGKIQAAGDAETAARVASEAFWRPGIPHLDRRMAHANRFMAAYRPEGGNMGLAVGRPQAAEPQGARGGPGGAASPGRGGVMLAEAPTRPQPAPQAAAPGFSIQPQSATGDRLRMLGETLRAYGQGRAPNTAPMREAIQRKQTANKTVEWLAKSGREDLAGAVQAGAMSPQEALQAVFAQRQGRERRYNVGGQLVDADGNVVFDGMAEERAQRAATGTRTAAWLRANGHGDVAGAMETGALSPQDALSVAMDSRAAERVKGQSPAGQIMADMANGLITREQASAEIKRLRERKGAAFEVGPDGTVRFSESGFAGTSGNPDRLSKALSSEDAKFIKGIREKADGTKVFGLLNAAESLVESYETGATAGITGTADRIGAAVGLTDGEEATQFEQLQAISKDLAMEGLKMLGGNDTERELLTSMQTTVRPTNRPETNRAILKRQRTALEIASERADFYSRWATTPKASGAVGLSSLDADGRGVEQAWREYQRQRWDALAGEPEAAIDPSPAGVPEGIDPLDWQEMTAEEKALWQN